MQKFVAIDASVLQPIIQAQPLSSVRMEAEFYAAGLPPSLLERLDGSVPLHAIENFVVRLTRRIGEPLFPFSCLDAEEHSGHATVSGIPLPHGLTGLESAQALVKSYSGVFSVQTFWWEIEGSRFWVLRKAAMTEWTDAWPTAQYNLRVILSGIRQLFGADMQPVALRLNAPPAEQDRPDELRDLPVIPGRGATGLAFPLAKIALAGATAGFAMRGERGQTDDGLEIDVTADEIVACIISYLRSDSSERRLAKAFGMSERSYRRNLAALRTSHRQLLENARLDIAFQLLSDPMAKVTDIAYDLGYSDPAHFTRFFKQRVGLPPSEYHRAISRTV